jgi:Xaa-Pro aminopeptidase
MKYAARIDATRRLMAEKGIDVLLIGQPANRQYLTGFTWHDESAGASSGWVVLTLRDGYFLTNFLHFEAVQRGVPHLRAIKSSGRIVEGLVTLLERFVDGKIGFEGSWISYSLFEELTNRLARRSAFVPIDGLVEEIRSTKDADEVAVLRRAITLTDEAFQAVVERMAPGQTERQVAWALERELRERGAEGMAFGPAVAAGPHAAIPHHEPTDYAIRAGDPIWIDMGARLSGYCADLTRSFCLDSASDSYFETWNLVLKAQQAALEGMRAGMSGKAGDALARDVFQAAGRAAEFGHSLGHGIGLMIHEAPRVAATADDVLRTGMIVTVEPGLYVPGWGGVRTEDVALVKEGGVDILSAAPKQPVVYSQKR